MTDWLYVTTKTGSADVPVRSPPEALNVFALTADGDVRAPGINNAFISWNRKR